MDRNFSSQEWFGQQQILQKFADHHSLVVKRNEPRLGAKEPDYFIQGNNGFVRVSANPGRLMAGIVYLGTWERIKQELLLSFHHCRILPPGIVKTNCTRAEFSPENKSHAKLIIELARLRTSEAA